MKSQWTKEMLIAGIQQLRISYLQNEDACIALMIVRYCHLLVGQTLSDQEKLIWQQQASHWEQCYQLNRINTTQRT